MRRLAEARRRRRSGAALARADLPEPVRVHLSTPRLPDRLPWRQVTYTVLDLETTGLDPATDAIVAAGAAGARRSGCRGHRVPAAGPPRPPGAPAAIRIHGLLPASFRPRRRWLSS